MKFLKITILSILLLLPGFVMADVTCQGTISNMYTYKLGGVYIKGSWGGDYVQICDLTATWKDVPVDVCKGWLSQALSVKTAQKEILLSYLDITSCTTIPSYGSAPSPRYLMLVP